MLTDILIPPLFGYGKDRLGEFMMVSFNDELRYYEARERPTSHGNL